MVDKAGGDVNQYNAAGQENYSDQQVAGVAPGGQGILEGQGGLGTATATGTQNVDQYLDQQNRATAGDAGYDQVHANTDINV